MFCSLKQATTRELRSLGWRLSDLGADPFYLHALRDVRLHGIAGRWVSLTARGVTG